MSSPVLICCLSAARDLTFKLSALERDAELAVKLVRSGPGSELRNGSSLHLLPLFLSGCQAALRA